VIKSNSKKRGLSNNMRYIPPQVIGLPPSIKTSGYFTNPILSRFLSIN